MSLTSALEGEGSRLITAVVQPISLYALYYLSAEDELTSAPVLFFTVRETGDDVAELCPVVLLDGYPEEERGGANYLGLSLIAAPNREDLADAIDSVRRREAVIQSVRRSGARK